MNFIKRHSWKITISTFVLILVSYFVLSFVGVLKFDIPTSSALPTSIFGGFKSGANSWIHQNVRSSVDSNRRGYFVFTNHKSNTDTDIAVLRTAYDLDGDNTCFGTTPTDINTAAESVRQSPDIASDDDGNFAVVWADDSLAGGSGYDIAMSLYDSDCNALVTELLVNTYTIGTQSTPRVAMDDDGNVIVVWSGEGIGDGDGIFARGFNSVGTPLDDSEYKVNAHTTGSQTAPDIALDPSNSGQFMVVWEGPCDNDRDDVADDSDGICAQGYSNYGTPTSGGNQLVNITTTGTQESPSVAISKGASTLRYVVAWDGQGSGDIAGIYARRATGCTASTCTFANTEISVNTTTTGSQVDPSVDMNYQGDFAVSWSDDGNDETLMAQLFAFGGDTIGSELTVSNNAFIAANELGSSTLSMGEDGYFFVVFNACIDFACNDYSNLVDSLYAGKGYEGFLYKTVDPLNRANYATYLLGGVVDADIAVDPQTGNVAVVWSGDGDDGAGTTDSMGIWFTLSDKDGNVINSKQNILVNTLVDGNQNRPSVSFFEDDSSFVVCYDGAGDVDGDSVADDLDGIFYRRYSSTGVATDTYEVLVNDDDLVTHEGCDADAGAGGNFVVTWHNVTDDMVVLSREGTDGDSTDLSPSVRSSSRSNPSVSMNADNDFVWIWEGDGTDDSDGIFMEKGSQIGGLDSLEEEIRVNSTTSGVQQNPEINLDDNGLILVTWEGNGPGDSSGIFARPYDLNAQDVAMTTNSVAETLINKKTSSNQDTVDLDGAGDGDYVITWLSDGLAMSETSLARWFEVDSDTHAITFNSPEFYTNELNFSYTPANVNGPAASPVGVYSGGELFILTRTKDGTGFNLDGDARMISVGSNPSLTSTLQQEVLSGGRTLVVPSGITFPAVSATAQSAVTNEVALRTDSSSEEDYIEVKDLFADGNSYSVTVSVATPFTFSGTASECTSNNLCIPNSSLEVRNYDQNGDSITAVFGSSSNFALDSSTDTYQALTSQQTLLTGDGAAVGRVRFYPEFRLTILPNVPPGTHTATLTFSLT